MIASLTRSIILLQMLALGGLAALPVHLQWLRWPGALLAAAASLTLLRAAIIFNNYLLSGALRQPMTDGRAAPKLPLLARIAQEIWGSMWCWFRLFPFARPFRVVHRSDGLPPVLMLHGYGANSGFWKPFAALVEAEVDALLQASGASQVVLLCHSMGGLVARAWIRRHGLARVARVVTLGTPHFGSTLAGYGMGLNASQMQHANGQPSAWLAQLAASESDASRALFVSILTRHDNIVAPQSSAELPGATNIAIDLVGHVALGFDARVHQLTLSHILAARGGGQGLRDRIEL